MDEEPTQSIRAIFHDLIGARLIEITQHDKEDFMRTGRGFVDLMFDSGDVLRIYCRKMAGQILFCLNPDDEAEDRVFGTGK